MDSIRPSINYKALLFVSIFFFIGCIPFFLNHKQSISYSKYNYLIEQILVFAMAFSFNGENRKKILLSPSFIAVSYVNINFALGSFAFEKGLVYDFLLTPYTNWTKYHLVMGYFNLVNLFIIFSYFAAKRIPIKTAKLLVFDFNRLSTGVIITMGVAVIAFFSFVEFRLDFLGGNGTFSIIPKTIGALIVIAGLSRYKNAKIRIWGYFLVFLFFASISWENKRDAVFLLLPIILIEARNIKFSLSLKKLLMLSGLIATVLYLIMVMSIYRGYGNFKPNSFIDAASYVDDYIRSPEFMPGFMNNLEVSYTYYHSNNAVETILKEPDRITFGMTLIKPLFIAIPRFIVPQKPKSIIHHYTVSVSEEYRRKGGSWPVSIQSEMFWNFHFLGILIVILAFLPLNALYKLTWALVNNREIVNYIPLLFLYQTSLVLFRGSGFDMFALFIGLAATFFVALKFLTRILIDK